MLMVKDFWATPEYAELLEQLNHRSTPTSSAARERRRRRSTACDDWTATFKKYKRYN